MNTQSQPGSNEEQSHLPALPSDELMGLLKELHKHDPKSTGDALDPASVYRRIQALLTTKERAAEARGLNKGLAVAEQIIGASTEGLRQVIAETKAALNSDKEVLK